MRLRDLIKGLTRYPSRLLGDKLEDDVSVTSFGDANLEAKMKNNVQRENQRLWNFSSKRTLTGTFAPQKPGHERRCDIFSFDESIFAEIFGNLGLVDQVCFALTCKILFTTYTGIVKDNAILPPQPTILPLSFVNSDDSYELNSLCSLRIPGGHIAPNVFCSSLEGCLRQMRSRSCL